MSISVIKEPSLLFKHPGVHVIISIYYNNTQRNRTLPQLLLKPDHRKFILKISNEKKSNFKAFFTVFYFFTKPEHEHLRKKMSASLVKLNVTRTP